MSLDFLNLCSCGKPSQAKVHVRYTLTRTLGDLSTESSDVDLYFCSEHEPEPWEVSERYNDYTSDCDVSNVKIAKLTGGQRT